MFSRNPTTGALTFVEQQKDGVGGVDGLAAVTSVIVSPDGAQVYTAAYIDKAVTVFSRNPTTGALSFLEVHKDGVAGVDGLSGAIEVRLSPDGKHLYAAGQTDNALAVFSRNLATGALTFVQVRRDDSVGGSVDGIQSATAVTVSPDGANVYATSYFGDNGVGVFSRDSVTGMLTFLEAHKDGTAGVHGLRGATAVAVTPDGTFVIASGFLSGAVAVFSRDPSTGRLTFIEAEKRARIGFDGLNGASAVMVSPDGAHVYATSENDDAVTAFRVICAGAAPGAACDDGDPCTTDDRCSDALCVNAAAPPLGCRTPTVAQKAKLLLRDNSSDAKDQVGWKWAKGAATIKAEFGDPLAADAYGFCIYDGSGLALKAIAPAGGICGTHACWSEKPQGFNYGDKDLTPDGLGKIVLKQGLEDGKAQIMASGKGAGLAMPKIDTLDSPITVRMTNLTSGECWEARYSFPLPEVPPGATVFSDKAD